VKLVRYDGGRTGLVAGDRVMDLAGIDPALGPGASWTTLIADWQSFAPRLEELAGSPPDGAPALADVTLEPPLPEPAARVFAMGGNFPMHLSGAVDKLDMPASIAEATDTVPPWGFFVIPGTIVGQGVDIRPPAHVQKLDYEGEVAVVLTGEPVREDGTLPIWGYTAWNDLSIRDAAFKLSKVDHGPLTWSLQKNFDTANACGPFLVVDEGATVEDLPIRLRVNGETRQDGTTADMRYSFGAIAAHLAEYLTLRPGDVILSGTPSGTAMEAGPAGRFLAAGDELEVEVGEAGVLRNRVAP
jgi:2-keto-4-pentenoate hydratase/2-oxohepta-3-ene-1,7-dioic acid hydratase in catechol pathway